MMKIEKKKKAAEGKTIQIQQVGFQRKSVIVMWVLLIGSICFGIYKNFTAIDIHTVHEKTVVKEKMTDTNSIESFVRNFAAVYHSWDNRKESLNAREKKLQAFLTEELQMLNADTVRLDCPTSSKVKLVEIWNVEKESDSEYAVTYRITQEISEGKKRKEIMPCYKVVVYADDENNMVIIQNPTVCSIPKKAEYESELIENDVEMKSDEMAEIEEFLNTFFKLYPTAEEKELAYYIKGNVMKPIHCKDYVFSEIVNPVFRKVEKGVGVQVVVKYLDQLTKTTQISEFDFVLEKEDNWRIVESK